MPTDLASAEEDALEQVEAVDSYGQATTGVVPDESAAQEPGWGFDAGYGPDGYDASDDDLQPAPLVVEPNE
ncbi:MAG: hypothetical protein RLN89_00590 [Parvibaculum sp.]